MTAAHKTLPLGTYVKVTCLKNGLSVVLRINDRGPFVSGRIIDLSYGAAQVLDVVQSGTAAVRVEAVQILSKQLSDNSTCVNQKQKPDFSRGIFTIQIGAFEALENAFSTKDIVSAAEKGNVRIKPFLNRGRGYYRVYVGKYYTLNEAQKKVESLKQKGFTEAFVLALDEEEK
jgi:rare lipoprotein A